MYQRRTLKILNILLALTAMATLAVCKVASASGANLIFSYPNGFASSGSAIHSVGASGVAGSKLNLTVGGSAHQAGASWYATQQNIQSFTTDFTFQITPSGKVPSIQGITFCIQNSNSTTNPAGNYGLNASQDANLVGYGSYVALGAGQPALGNSIAVKFDLNNYSQSNYPSGGYPNSTGLYINGGPSALLIAQNDLNPYGINLYSGHIMAAHIVYDGSLLTMVLKDTATNVQARYSWPVNIPAAVGSNTAWVGFTGGEVDPAEQGVLTWSYSTGYNTRLATPTFNITPGSYTSAQNVTLSGPSGATIYYTTNGQPPTSSSTPYTGPISVSSNEAIQAVAIESGYTDSAVAVGNFQIQSPGAPLLNFPNGFASASNLITTVGYAKISGSNIQLTDTNSANAEAGAAWYSVPVNVASFTTNFTLQFVSAQENGMMFVIQNQVPAASSYGMSTYVSGGPTAIGQNTVGLGYGYAPGTGTIATGGILNSVGVSFNLSDNGTGLYKNGAEPVGSDQTITGITLNKGNPINVALTYNGTTLSMTMTDTVTLGTFSHSWAVNIPTAVGGNNAYVGFTGSTNGQVVDDYIQKWTYNASSGQATPVPAAPTNLRVQ